MMNLLFICTGNTCRSPMAEVLAANMIQQDRSLCGKVCVGSAGMYAVSGAPMSENAEKALMLDGQAFCSHKSRPFTKELAEQADLILGMTDAHVSMAKTLAPECAYKVFPLKEVAGQQGDILDPFGGSLETYQSSLADIKNALTSVLERIKETM